MLGVWLGVLLLAQLGEKLVWKSPLSHLKLKVNLKMQKIASKVHMQIQIRLGWGYWTNPVCMSAGVFVRGGVGIREYNLQRSYYPIQALCPWAPLHHYWSIINISRARTGTSGNSGSRPFPGIPASHSRSRKLGMIFYSRSRSQKLGMLFLILIPVPKIWECNFWSFSMQW